MPVSDKMRDSSTPCLNENSSIMKVHPLMTICVEDFVESLTEALTIKAAQGNNTEHDTHAVSISCDQDTTKRQFGLEASQKDLPFVSCRIKFERKTQVKHVIDTFANAVKEYLESRGYSGADDGGLVI